MRPVAQRVSEAFTETARQILVNPELTALRMEIEAVVRENPGVALALALCSGVIAALSDYEIEGSESWDLGAGFNLGINFDMGSIQSPQYNNLAASIRYSIDQFSTTLGGGMRIERPETEGEEEQIVGYGTGEVRFGDRTNFFTASLMVDSEGQFTARGRLSAGTELWGNDQFLFTADLSHSSATDETLFRTGAVYRIGLGMDEWLSLGAMLNYSSESGAGATGYIDYTNSMMFFRADINTSGIPIPESVTGGEGVMSQLSFGLQWDNP
jgi:hypothetical protein